MAECVSVICLPDGLEVVFRGNEGELQAHRFRLYRLGMTTNVPFQDASEALREKRFATVEELVTALRGELSR